MMIGEIFRLNASEATVKKMEGMREIRERLIDMNLVDDCNDEHRRCPCHRICIGWFVDR